MLLSLVFIIINFRWSKWTTFCFTLFPLASLIILTLGIGPKSAFTASISLLNTEFDWHVMNNQIFLNELLCSKVIISYLLHYTSDIYELWTDESCVHCFHFRVVHISLTGWQGEPFFLLHFTPDLAALTNQALLLEVMGLDSSFYAWQDAALWGQWRRWSLGFLSCSVVLREQAGCDSEAGQPDWWFVCLFLSLLYVKERSKSYS